MTEMIYEYDGSFEGFLTCIFESYAQRSPHRHQLR